MGSRHQTRMQNFWEKVELIPFHSCWEWVAGKNSNGYGAFMRNGAHRASYELHIGPIPKGKMVLHRCDNRTCVNPDHLFLGTNDDNMKDMVKKKRQRPCRGEQNGNAKLTKEEALEIRRLYQSGLHTMKSLARMFEVRSPSTVNSVIRGGTWQ